MQSHEIDFIIHGEDLQAVEIELDQGETVIAEAGMMNWVEDGIMFETKLGDGSEPDKGMFGKMLDMGKRAISGESLFLTHFTNTATTKRKVAFAAPYPGKIIPLDLGRLGGKVICEKGAFLCAAKWTKLWIAFNKKLSAGFFGGEGFILETIEGDGKVFLHAWGTIVKKELTNETIRVDTGCIVAFSPGIEYDIERAGNLKSMFFGWEGLFLATLRGTGSVLLQTLPFSRLADRIISHAPVVGRGNSWETSVAGQIGGATALWAGIAGIASLLGD